MSHPVSASSRRLPATADGNQCSGGTCRGRAFSPTWRIRHHQTGGRKRPYKKAGVSFLRGSRIGHCPADSTVMEVVWAAPPTGAPLARQGRFASLRDGLRPPLDPRASARPDGRRKGRSETCPAHSRGPDARSREGQDPTHGNVSRSQKGAWFPAWRTHPLIHQTLELD